MATPFRQLLFYVAAANAQVSNAMPFSGFSGDYLVTTCGCRLNLSAFNCKGKGRNEQLLQWGH
jgi:hypothetical protein